MDKFQSTFRFLAATLFSLAVVTFIAFAPRSAHAQSGNVYGNNQAQVSGLIEEGQVLQVAIKTVEASGQARATGGAIGGVIGGLAGANPNIEWQQRAITGVLGAAVGAFAGERIANASATKEAQELIIAVTDQNGRRRLITVVQPAPFDALSRGDKVFVSNTQGAIRVIKQDL